MGTAWDLGQSLTNYIKSTRSWLLKLRSDIISDGWWSFDMNSPVTPSSEILLCLWRSTVFEVSISLTLRLVVNCALWRLMNRLEGVHLCLETCFKTPTYIYIFLMRMSINFTIFRYKESIVIIAALSLNTQMSSQMSQGVEKELDNHSSAILLDDWHVFSRRRLLL